MNRIAVIGGGITGLATAWQLEQKGSRDITLFERSPRVGGKLQSANSNGFIVESSADSVYKHKAETMNLIRALGKQSELIEPAASEFSILLDGRLRQIPLELLRFGSISDEAIDQAPTLSEEGKAAARNESNAPSGIGDDESIGSFFRRRYGREFSQKFVEPLLAGTHGGSPEKLSMRALFPGYLKLEREAGSLAAGMKGRSGSGSGGSSFFSLRNGLGSLAKFVTESFQYTKVLQQQVLSIGHAGSQLTVDDELFDHVVLTVPAPVAASILDDKFGSGVELVRNLPNGSAAIVTLAYSDLSVALNGSGFLVPYFECRKITGATYSSNKWPNRAPNGASLVRVFLGRFDLTNSSDEQLIQIAMDGLTETVGDMGAPSVATVSRWINCMPLYQVGHCDRITEIREAFHPWPNLFLAGSSYHGIGISDCIRQGFDAAEVIAG